MIPPMTERGEALFTCCVALAMFVARLGAGLLSTRGDGFFSRRLCWQPLRADQCISATKDVCTGLSCSTDDIPALVGRNGLRKSSAVIVQGQGSG